MVAYAGKTGKKNGAKECKPARVLFRASGRVREKMENSAENFAK